MNKLPLIVTVFSTLLGLPAMVAAYDSDPGYGPSRPVYSEGRGYMPWQGGRAEWSAYGGERNVPIYYRPTQRYYGPGYTVNYRYIPVYRGDSSRDVAVTGATNFRSEAFKLAPETVSAWGVNSPKVTVKDPRSAVQRSAVTSIVRKKTSSKDPATAAPAIAPSGTDSGTPATSPANP